MFFHGMIKIIVCRSPRTTQKSQNSGFSAYIYMIDHQTKYIHPDKYISRPIVVKKNIAHRYIHVIDLQIGYGMPKLQCFASHFLTFSDWLRVEYTSRFNAVASDRNHIIVYVGFLETPAYSIRNLKLLNLDSAYRASRIYLDINILK